MLVYLRVPWSWSVPHRDFLPLLCQMFVRSQRVSPLSPKRRAVTWADAGNVTRKFRWSNAKMIQNNIKPSSCFAMFQNWVLSFSNSRFICRRHFPDFKRQIMNLPIATSKRSAKLVQTCITWNPISVNWCWRLPTYQLIVLQVYNHSKTNWRNVTQKKTRKPHSGIGPPVSVFRAFRGEELDLEADLEQQEFFSAPFVLAESNRRLSWLRVSFRVEHETVYMIIQVWGVSDILRLKMVKTCENRNRILIGCYRNLMFTV